MDAVAECSSVQAAAREWRIEERRERAVRWRIEGPALTMVDDVYLERADCDWLKRARR